MTDQEIFDKVLAHCRQQGVSATNDAGDCMYRGRNGTKCAVGCLIPDNVYVPSMETFLTFSDVVALIPGVTVDQSQLLRHLQSAHDMGMPSVHGESLDGYEGEMRGVADRFGLNYGAPTP